MPLPFSAAGCVHVAGASSTAVATERLEHALEQLRAKRIDRSGNQIEFTGGIFRAVRGDNLLVAIGSGELSLKHSGQGLDVAYRLRFTQMLLTVSGLVLIVLGPPVIGAPNLTALQAGWVLVVAWLWLFGANVVLTLLRFPRWIRRTLAEGSSQ